MRLKTTPFLLFVIAACSTDTPVSAPLFESPATLASLSATEDAIAAEGASINAALEAEGASYRLYQQEWLSADGVDESNNTYFFASVGNKRLLADFVPGDPRRGGGTNITYWVNSAAGNTGGLTGVETTAAIDRAMTTWDNVACSDLPITRLAAPAPPFGGDILHLGWVPLGQNILGVTQTFIFVSGGVPTDSDGNGYFDVAFRRIFYSSLFGWNINARFDVETVALHEAGHGLSQAHFGKAFRGESNGKLHFAPRAVMNAAYSGIQQSIGATDNAGHCANWGNWPNN